jgi:hypothetical protein
VRRRSNADRLPERFDECSQRSWSSPTQYYRGPATRQCGSPVIRTPALGSRRRGAYHDRRRASKVEVAASRWSPSYAASL